MSQTSKAGNIRLVFVSQLILEMSAKFGFGISIWEWLIPKIRTVQTFSHCKRQSYNNSISENEVRNVYVLTYLRVIGCECSGFPH